MLPKTFRLPLRPTQRFEGTRTQTPHFSLVASPNNLTHSRVAVIIPKKVIALSTARNRLKRQVTAITLPLLTTPPFRDLLILPRTSAATLPPSVQKQELSTLLHV